MLLQALSQALVRCIPGRGSSIHYDIDRGQFVLMGSKRLANQAFYAIAPHRISHRLGSDRESQARCRQGVQAHCKCEQAIRMAAALFVHAIEIGFATQALRWPEGQLGSRQSPARTALRPRAVCVPWHGGGTAPDDHPSWPSVRESHACACDAGYWVDTCASWKLSWNFARKPMTKKAGRGVRRKAREGTQRPSECQANTVAYVMRKVLRTRPVGRSPA